MKSMKRQNDRILKEELPGSEGALYATGDQWRNNSRKNEGMEPKQKQYSVVDVTGDRSKVRCCKEYWSGLPFPTPGDLPNPRTEPMSPALAGRFSITEPPEQPCNSIWTLHILEKICFPGCFLISNLVYGVASCSQVPYLVLNFCSKLFEVKKQVCPGYY